MITSQVILKKGREKSVHNRHPWIFSGAIDRVEGNPSDGHVVDVWDSRARFVARGVINQRSQIVVRILTWDQDERIGEGFWRGRLGEPSACAGWRRPSADAYRTGHQGRWLAGLDCGSLHLVGGSIPLAGCRGDGPHHHSPGG
jgi:23S rRNA (cytosine1962-C5)-methyltransferase